MRCKENCNFFDYTAILPGYIPYSVVLWCVERIVISMGVYIRRGAHLLMPRSGEDVHLLQLISFSRSSSDNLNQSAFTHLTGKQICARFFRMQKFLQIIIIHLAILCQIIQHRSHLRRDNNRLGFFLRCCCFDYFLFCVHVWQNQLERIRCNLNTGLYHAIPIEVKNLSYTCSVGFNQFQPVENLRQFPIAWLRDTAADIIRRQTGQQTTDRDKLHAGIIYVYDNTATVAVIPVDERI